MDTKALRKALSTMHARACGDTSKVYMSIPPDPARDADLMLSAAIDEIDSLRAQLAEAKKLGEARDRTLDAQANLVWAQNMALEERDAKVRAAARAETCADAARVAQDLDCNYSDDLISASHVAEEILGLAPCPSGFRVVEVAEVENENGDTWKAEALELRKMVSEMGLKALRNGSVPVPCVVVEVETLEKVKAAIRGLMGRLVMVAESPNRRQALDLGDAALSALTKGKP